MRRETFHVCLHLMQTAPSGTRFPVMTMGWQLDATRHLIYAVLSYVTTITSSLISEKYIRKNSTGFTLSCATPDLSKTKCRTFTPSKPALNKRPTRSPKQNRSSTACEPLRMPLAKEMTPVLSWAPRYTQD